MRKLLRANLMRLKMDKVFWIGLAFMALLGVYAVCDARTSQPPMESQLLSFIPFVCLAASAFTALFVGTEYADGVLRNKLIVGRTRREVYLSNYVTCAAANLMFSLAYIVCYLALAIPLLGPRETSLSVLVTAVLLSALVIAVWTALCTLIAMLWANRAYAVTACILLTLVLFFSGSYLESRLDEPEFYTNYISFVNGTPVMGDQVPNPAYLQEDERKVYEFLLDVTPGGQIMELLDEMRVRNPILAVASDCAILLAATFCGLVCFKRKDLK